MERKQMRTWAEIDLDALAHNYRALRACAPQSRFLGVVKADAYGHGAIPVARRLEELGAEYLAVATMEEGIELRGGGVSLPILVFGSVPPELAGEAAAHGLTLTVCGPAQAQALSDAARLAGRRVRVHMKVDTGMGRLGLPVRDPGETAAALAPLWALPGVEAEGIYTHFASADDNEEATMAQFTRFLDVLDALKARHGLEAKIRHCAASAAVLHYPCTHLDMIRPGIALYGHYPHPSCEGLDGPGLCPVMTLKSRVAEIKTLPAGHAVSYGGAHVLERESRVAVLPIGYADGLRRSLSGRMEVLLHGRRVRQIGRICMDLCMADVTGLPQAEVGDVATIFGPGLPLEEKAEAAGTIQYELLTALSRRVPRLW